MSYELYRGIFIGGAALCIIMLIVTIVQLIHLKASRILFEIEKEITYVYTMALTKE